MKLLFDLFPVLLFFAAFKLGNAFPDQAITLVSSILGALMMTPLVAGQAPILLATLLAIVATLLQVMWLLVRKRKVEPMLWISLALIVVFGGATIYLQDETFIKWKPTILYWAFACVLALGTLLLKKNFVRSLLSQSMQLPDPVWHRLNWAWTLFFMFAGALNIAVAYTVDTQTWVNFKLFGLMGLTFAFALVIGLWMTRYLQEPSNAD